MVEVDLINPLLRGTNIKLGTERIWVDCKYEMLPTFCHYCGRIGHPERLCEHKMADSEKSVMSERQYGDWLRAQAGQGGKGSEI